MTAPQTPAVSGVGDTAGHFHRHAYTEALRAAAELIAAHPELPNPCVWGYGTKTGITVQWQILREDPGAQKALARQIARAIGGKWDKGAYDNQFHLEQKRDALTLQIIAAREAVCERVVVGTETVTLPATEAQPAQPARVEEREVIEWRCPPLLADVEAAS